MPRPSREFFLCFGFFLFAACADPNASVFPGIPTSTSESDLVLPNPISIAIDPINDQFVVANSNVDIFYDQGSLALMTVDTTDPAAPFLTTLAIVATPNYAGDIFLEPTTGNLFVPYRSSSLDNSDFDTVELYSISNTSLTFTSSELIADNPFGIDGDAATVLAVSDNTLTVFDASLAIQAEIDLTTASDAGLADTNTAAVEDVAYDAALNLAYVSNPLGRMLVIDLTSNEVIAAVTAPASSRALLLSGTMLFLSDPSTNAVWAFDTTRFTAPASTPGDLDDSTWIADVISVGSSPTGMAISTAGDRLFVSNSLEDSISVIDTNSLQELARLDLSAESLSAFSRFCDQPQGLAYGTFGAREYLLGACFGSNAIVLIDAESLSVVDVYPDNSL